MSKKRISLLFSIYFVIFIFLLLRVFFYQVFAGGDLSKAASNQRIADSNIEKPRGNILDKNDISFTSRSKIFSLVLKPLYFKENPEDLRKVCATLDLNFIEIEGELINKKGPVIVECDESKLKLALELGISGISTISSLKRYDSDSLARHVLGYLNKKDRTGEAGVEKLYEDILQFDQKSSVGVVIDAKKNPVEGLGYSIIKVGSDTKKLDVKLTLDYHIQDIVEKVMERNNIKGAVVVQDVINGDVTAMASKPDFEQDNIIEYLNSADKELFNRATASYNLGSIFKIIDSAFILEKGIKSDDDFYCPGYINVGNKTFKCSSYNDGGHGVVDFKKAFALSCNTYFIDMGIKSGYTQLIEMAQRFGLGETTGIKKQGIYESAGNLPDLNSYYSGGDIANISIGQGEIMATPLQISNLVSTIANGGIKNNVNVVDCIVDDRGNKIRDLKNNSGKRVISKSIADMIKNMMEEVTETGTGTSAKLEEYGGAAGKTGSAETSNKDVVHAWFAGYFPKTNPKYAITVFVENGQKGGKVAAPIFAEIAKEIMQKGF